MIIPFPLSEYEEEIVRERARDLRAAFGGPVLTSCLNNEECGDALQSTHAAMRIGTMAAELLTGVERQVVFATLGADGMATLGMGAVLWLRVGMLFPEWAQAVCAVLWPPDYGTSGEDDGPELTFAKWLDLDAVATVVAFPLEQIAADGDGDRD